nr:PREDICTED: zinc finger protein 615-like [Linepithema humile]
MDEFLYTICKNTKTDANDTLICNVCGVQLEEREYIFDEVSQKEKLIITLPTKILLEADSEYICWDCHERINNYYEFAQNIVLNSKKKYNTAGINSAGINSAGINSLLVVDENHKIEITAISNLYSDMIYTCPNCNINLKILVKNNPEGCYYPFHISLIVVDQTEKLILEKNAQACEDTTELVKGICRNKLNVEDKLNNLSLCNDIAKDITNHNEQNIDKMQDSSPMLQEDINNHDFIQNVSEHSKENLNTAHINLLEDNENEKIEMMTLSKLYSDVIYTCPKCNIDLMILIRSNHEDDCNYTFQISLVIVNIQSSIQDEAYKGDTMELVNGAYRKESNVENELQESLLNQEIASDIIHEKPSTNKICGTLPVSQKGITFQKRKILHQKGRKKKIRKNKKTTAKDICTKEKDYKMDTNETSANEATNAAEKEESAVNCSLCGESITIDLDPDAINDLITCAACEDSTLSLMVDGYEAKAISRREYQCSMCPKRFIRKERLEFHEMRHNENMNEFVCSTCNNEFSAENSLYEHYLFVHKGARPHICELCGKSYQIKARLKEHLRTHTGEKPYQCNVCGLRCMTVNALKGHRKSHFSNNRHICNICNKSYSKKQNMNEHLEKHWKMDKNISLPRLFTCPLCNEGLPTYRLLKNHMSELHQIGRKDPLVTSQQPLHECNECNEKFKHQMSLKAHKEKVHEGRTNPTFECDICKATFRIKQMLITHIKNKHGGEKRYKCAQCGKGFSGTKSLYNHILLHTGRKPYSCEYCDMSFRRKDSRDLHRRKHTNEQPFQCQDCDQSFSTYNNRSKHRKKEHGEGITEKCPECREKYNSQQEVRIHLNKHLGEKLNELLRITRCVSRTGVK